ncbi:Tetratricopeptide-like helical protein [Lasiodiplodia theobromae]|uniref:Tetratricopeptide-like helical protein n=1 Tax=Lasiodiplodia theobromae TaxID=45133 RepID=UPI0015C2EA99|nr:Tetratricopeptide-like helical protein [Lasiodiplodia theobromae]KAF4535794.1 Tetratricopeptide-like helical protein [Lasiodiplodia theobromae]
MMSHERSRHERERKVEALVAFATTLSRRLHRHLSPPVATAASSTSDEESPESLTDIVPALSTHLTTTFPLAVPTAVVLAKRDTLDRLATEIWNAATRLGREREQHAEGQTRIDKKVLCKVRAFAVLVLDAAAACDSSGKGKGKVGDGNEGTLVDKGVRVLKVALKVVRSCVEVGMVEEGGLLRVLECAAGWEGRLEGLVEGLKRDGDADVGMVDVDMMEVVGRLRAEYWILRMVHAWKQARLDLAEHMFSKSGLEPNRLTADTGDMLTDTLFEIGRDLFRKGQYEDAVKWLDRAYDIIGEQNVEELDHDAVELRLAILNFLVRACLKVNTAESQDKARGIVDLLELDHGDKMVVHLLKLDVISADQELDVEQYYNVVVRMIRSIVLTDTNFKTIMHHAHIIKGKSPELACKALDKLLHDKLFQHENPQWIEKVTVTQIWILANSGDDQPSEFLTDLLNIVLQNSRPFDAPATHASQTILWKKIETLYSHGKYVESEAWCEIALHPLFTKAGESNKAKISRKVILCALSRQEHNTARKVFFEMPEKERNNPMTRFLMYKSAIRDQQPEFAAECLDTIKAQGLRDQKSAIAALQKALEKYDYGAPVAIHLPALLRSTIRLLVNQLSASSDINEEAMKELLRYELESALKRRDWDSLDTLWDECFDIPDSGTGTKETGGSWYTRHLETLADLALVIHADLTKAQPSSSASTTTTTATHRARILGVLQRIVNQSCSSGTIGSSRSDDAAVHLSRWIRCLFKLSIDNSHALDDPDAIPLQCIEQATNVISSSLSSSIAGAVQRERGKGVDENDGGGGSHCYPQIEAEWLASTAFNRAIDFFCAGNDARCKVWAEKAMELARAAEQRTGRGEVERRERGLYAVLMDRYKGLLRWE